MRGIHGNPWNSAEKHGIQRKAWNSAKNVDFSLSSWNSEFHARIQISCWNSRVCVGIYRKAWNSRKGRGIGRFVPSSLERGVPSCARPVPTRRVKAATTATTNGPFFLPSPLARASAANPTPQVHLLQPSSGSCFGRRSGAGGAGGLGGALQGGRMGTLPSHTASASRGGGFFGAGFGSFGGGGGGGASASMLVTPGAAAADARPVLGKIAGTSSAPARPLPRSYRRRPSPLPPRWPWRRRPPPRWPPREKAAWRLSHHVHVHSLPGSLARRCISTLLFLFKRQFRTSR